MNMNCAIVAMGMIYTVLTIVLVVYCEVHRPNGRDS